MRIQIWAMKPWMLLVGVTLGGMLANRKRKFSKIWNFLSVGDCYFWFASASSPCWSLYWSICCPSVKKEEEDKKEEKREKEEEGGEGSEEGRWKKRKYEKKKNWLYISLSFYWQLVLLNCSHYWKKYFTLLLSFYHCK